MSSTISSAASRLIRTRPPRRRLPLLRARPSFAIRRQSYLQHSFGDVERLGKEDRGISPHQRIQQTSGMLPSLARVGLDVEIELGEEVAGRSERWMKLAPYAVVVREMRMVRVWVHFGRWRLGRNRVGEGWVRARW